MKKLLMMAIVNTIAFATHAQIQRNLPPQSASHFHADSSGAGKQSLRQQMIDLKLTPDQKIKFRAIHQNTKDSKETIMANDSLSADQKHFQLKTLRKEAAIKIDAILSDNQKIKMQEIRERKKNNKKNVPQQAAMEEEITTLPENK